MFRQFGLPPKAEGRCAHRASGHHPSATEKVDPVRTVPAANNCYKPLDKRYLRPVLKLPIAIRTAASVPYLGVQCGQKWAP